MARASVEVRGERYDVEFNDHGWEPDTNAHEIGWAFVDRDAPQDLTEEEEQSVYDQLAQIEPERFPDDVI